MDADHSQMGGGGSITDSTQFNPLVASAPNADNQIKSQRYIDGTASPPPRGRAWMLSLAAGFVRRNMVSEPRVWFISSFAVCMCVITIAVLYTAVGSVSMVFLKIVEDKLGECDLLMLPKVGGQPYINFTQVATAVSGAPHVAALVPRWMMLGRVVSSTPGAPHEAAKVMLYDSQAEDRLRVSRGWQHRPLGPGECHVSSSVLHRVQAEEGDDIYILPDLDGLVDTLGGTQSLWQAFNPRLTSAQRSCVVEAMPWLRGFTNVQEPADLTDWLMDHMLELSKCAKEPPSALLVMSAQAMLRNGLPCTVVDSVTSPVGKWPEALGGVIAMDMHQPFIEESFGTLEHYAMSVMVLMHHRVSSYMEGGHRLENDLAQLADAVVGRLGLPYPITLTEPLKQAFKAVEMAKLTFDSTTILAIGFLVALAAMLLVSLYVGSVADMTYEFGLLRSLGMRKDGMVTILVVRCTALAIPSTLIGLALAVLFYLPIASWFASFGNVSEGQSLQQTPVVWAALIGIAVPFLANLQATQEALSVCLRNALSFVRTASNEVTLTRVKLDEMGLAPWQTALAVVAAVSGGLVFYLVPYAFLFQKFEIFFLVMQFIFAAMVVGLAMVVQPLLPTLEKLILRSMLWGSDRRLLSTISGNLAAHRPRSLRSSLVATLCVAFIIFCEIGIRNHALAFKEFVSAQIGSDLVVTVKPHFKIRTTGLQNVATTTLPAKKLKEFLENERAKGDLSHIKQTAFITKPAASTANIVNTYITNFAWFPFQRPSDVIGVEQTYLEATYSKFALSSALDKTAEADGPVEALYTNDLQEIHANSEFMHTSGWSSPSVRSGTNYTHHDPIYANPVLSLSPELPFVLNVNKHDGEHDEISDNKFLWGRGFMYKMPGIVGFSEYSVVAFLIYSPVLVSIPAYMDITGTNEEDVAYWKLFIRLKDPENSKSRLMIKDAVRAYIDSTGNQVIVVDAIEAAEAMNDVTDLVLFLTDLMSMACLLLFFFLSTVTFSGNIQDNSWELGVLRAIGLTKAQVSRIYIYEAVTLVLASVMGGIAVGLCVGATVTLQFCIFTEMPFNYDLPVFYMLLILLVAGSTAVLASYFPARKLLSQQISSIIKGA